MIDLATALALRSQNVRPGATALLGWVQSWTSSSVTVLLDEDADSITIPRLRGYSPTAGDVALILKAGGAMYAVGALNSGPVTRPDPDEGDAPPPADVIRTKSFRPGFTGTWRDPGWRSDSRDVLQGDWTGKGTNWGAAYYGRGPSSLSGTCTKVTVRVMRARGGSPARIRPVFRLLDHKNKPAVFPSGGEARVEGPLLGVHDAATVELPTSWGQQLIDGSAGGVGLGDAAAPYIGCLGRSFWGPSFELTIKYQRST